MQRCQTCVRVSESSQVGEARRAAAQIAESAGLGETDRGSVAIIVTELANNLARHTTGGEVLLRPLGHSGDGDPPGIEVLAIDRGPGMADVAVCLRDGYSTGGTPGTGLGAARRLSTVFDIYSAQPTGTVVLARVTGQPAVAAPAAFDWGVVNLPAPRESACGDTWRVAADGGRLAILMADGLGHGPAAAAAADSAAAAFNADPFAGPKAVLESAHERMHGTRGGAVAVALVDAPAGSVRFAGVGNISGSIASAGDSRGTFSHNGTAGVQVRRFQEFDYPWTDAATLLLHSDGLQTRWSLDAYPGVARRHPAVLAALLYRDFTRGRDDLTVAVVRAAAAGRV